MHYPTTTLSLEVKLFFVLSVYSSYAKVFRQHSEDQRTKKSKESVERAFSTQSDTSLYAKLSGSTITTDHVICHVICDSHYTQTTRE